MITKILLTLLVILSAYALIKRQRANASRQKSTNDAPCEDNSMRLDASDLRLGAYMFVAIMFMLGGYFYYQRWRQDHQLLTIRLYHVGEQQAVEYQVFRYQLDNRSFITTDGIQVKVSDNERMEILSLSADK